MTMMNRVRVANELGAGNGKGAKFATLVSVTTSTVIGFFFWLLVLFFHEKIAFIFSTSPPVVEEVKKLSVLLAFTILLNSVQPVLSGNILSLIIVIIYKYEQSISCIYIVNLKSFRIC